MSGLIEELKRRNVFKVGTAYVVAAWLAAQVADIFLDPLGVPEWFIQSLLILLLIGFPVALLLAWVYELTPEGIKKEKDVDRSQSITGQTGQKLNLTIIAVLALAVALLLFDRFRPDASEIAKQEPEVVAAEANIEPSIAVLPFVDLSPNRDQDYFSDGISEEILNTLARVRELKVAGRTSSFAYKGMNPELSEIGQTLKVDHILEGSVRTDGNKVRITAQLIQVEDGFQVWSQTYDRVLDDVFAIQYEIANAILKQMKSSLLNGVDQVATASTTSPALYDQYLMARQRMYLRNQAGLQSASELLDEVITQDPDFAPAYALRGIATLLLSETSYGDIPRAQSRSQGRVYLDRAIALDANSAEALAGLGLWGIQSEVPVEESRGYLNRALEINPNLVDASNWLQQTYGRYEMRTQLRILEEMFEKDPFYRPGLANLSDIYSFFDQVNDLERVVERVRPLMKGDTTFLIMESTLLSLQGELARATPLAEQALDNQPNYFRARVNLGFRLIETAQWERLAELETLNWQRVWALQRLNRLEEATLRASEWAGQGGEVNSLWGIYLQQGRPEQVAQFFNERWDSVDAFIEDFPITRFHKLEGLTYLAVAFRAVDDQAKYERALELAQDFVQKDTEIGFRHGLVSILHAQYYTVIGDYEAALQRVEQAYEMNYFYGGDLEWWTLLDPLRGDPRFQEIEAKMREKVNFEREKLGLGAIGA